jgi:hypothetical protein
VQAYIERQKERHASGDIVEDWEQAATDKIESDE